MTPALETFDLSVALLSWRHLSTLRNTLNSYRRFGLLGRPNTEYLCYFQEVSAADRRAAARFGFEAMGTGKNVGIAPAYAALVERARGRCFLFLENDWELIQPPWPQLDEALELLQSRETDVVRLRSRARPGEPLWSRQFRGFELDHPEHLLDCVHWVEDPTQFSALKRLGSLYATTSQHANWTNNPTVCRTEFLREHVVPRVGVGDIELDLQHWWRAQDFVVAQGEGLFTHNRLPAPFWTRALRGLRSKRPVLAKR